MATNHLFVEPILVEVVETVASDNSSQSSLSKVKTDTIAFKFFHCPQFQKNHLQVKLSHFSSDTANLLLVY